MYDLLFFVGLISGWIILNAWILPRLGIPTCMSGTCRMPRAKQRSHPDSTGQGVHETGVRCD